MVEHGPRRINEDDVKQEVHVPPETHEIPEPRKPDHDTDPKTNLDRRRLGKKFIAAITGILVIGGGVAFAKAMVSREANNLPPRNPEVTAGASPFPTTGEQAATPTPEKQAKNYKFDANTRVFAANNLQSFMEVQSRFNIDKALAPTEQLATTQLPSILQNAANINNRKQPAFEVSRTNSEADLIAYNTDPNGLIATMLANTGIKPDSEAFKLIARHNELNIKEETTSQFTLKNNKLIAERIKRLNGSELGGPVATEEFEISGGPRLRGETQLWEYGEMGIDKIEK